MKCELRVWVCVPGHWRGQLNDFCAARCAARCLRREYFEPEEGARA